MYPSWGKHGGGSYHNTGQYSNYHNKPPPPRGSSLYSGNYGGYGSSGSYSASSGPGSSNFQSLREQHLQQMQQLQQLHQKQLQSVLHSSSTPYSGGSSHSSSGTWHGSSSSSGSTGYSSGPNYQQQHQHHGPPPSFPPPSHGPPPPFHVPPPNQQQHGPGEQQAPVPIPGPPSGEKQDHKPPVTPTEDDQVQQSKLTVPQPALHQSNQSPAPNVPPVHLLHSEQQQYPPPPTAQSESTDRVIPSHTPPETNSPAGSTAPVLDISEPRQEQSPDLSSMSLQEQQQYWYKQHLQSLQKLKQQQKNEKENKQELTGQCPVPPPPKEPPADAAPPPPPPREELPPPPPPEEVKTDIVTSTEDPEEAARLKQLQAAAAQWQHTQHQRAGYQYQAMMQQHTHLQQLLQQYQQFMQQPAHLQTMPLEMQLRHFEMQQHQFIPLFQEWERHFKIWQEQFQAYPHKDQLKEYESQWKQWQDQMQSTYAHLHERVMTLRNMQHQYASAPPYGMVGIPPYGQYHQPPPSVHGSILPPPPVTSVPPPPVTSVPPPPVTSVPPPPVTSVPPPPVTSVPPSSVPSVPSVPPPLGSRVPSVPPPPVTSVPPPMSVPPPPVTSVPPPPVTSVPPPPVTSVPPPPVTSVPPPMSVPPPPVTSVPPPMSVPPPPVTSVPPPMSVPPPPVTSVPPPMSVPPPPMTSVPPPMSVPPPPVPLPNCPPPSQPAQTSPQVSSSLSKVFSETPNSAVIQPPSSLASGQPGFLTTSLPSAFTSSSPSVKPFDLLSPPSQGSPAESQRNSRLNTTSEMTAPGFQTPVPKPDLPSGHCSQSKYDQQSDEKQGRFNQLSRFEHQHRFGPPPTVEPLPVSVLQQPPKFDSPVKTEQPPKESDAPTRHPPRINVPSKTESPVQPDTSKSVSQPSSKLNEFAKMETLKAQAQQTKEFNALSKGDQNNKFEESTAHVPRQSDKLNSTQPIPKDAMSQDQNLKTCKPSSSVPIISSSGNLTTDYDFDADGDFFLPNDPIPQTSVSVGEQKQSDSKENSLKVNLEEVAKPASTLPINDDKNVFASNRNVTKPQEVQKDEAKPFEKDTKKNSDTVAKPDTPKGTPKLCNLETQKAISTPKTEGFSQGPVPIRGPPGKTLHSNIASKPISAKQDSFTLDYRGMHGEDKKENSQNQGINSWKNSQMEKQNLTERKPLLFHEETWHGEEEQGHFREPYFQNRGRGRPAMDREQVEDMSRQRGWEEPGSDYWPDREPFQRENRPPFRRPPLLAHEPMERDPRHNFPLPHDPLDRDRRHPPPLPYEYMEREPRHPPLLPHDTVERDTRRPPVFPQQVMDREPRHPPPLPHELIERDPRGHAPHEVIGREMRRPPIPFDMERDRRRGEYFPEYEHEFDVEQNRFVAPYTDYNENYNQDQGYYMQREDWEVEDRRRNCPQYPPQLPPDRFCEDRWIEKRDHSYLYERDFQDRGSYGDEEYAEQALFRQEERDYMPDRPEWSREPLHERRYMPDLGNRRPQFEDRLEVPSALPPSTIPPPHHDAPEVMVDDSSGAAKGVLALSQRQHEIILKAAQELKMLRERQEQFQVHNEYGPSDTNAQFSHAEPVAAGMLGFDMPPDNLQSKVFSTNDAILPNAAQSFSEEQHWGGGQLHNQWDVGNSSPGPDHNFGLSGSEPVPPHSKPPVIPKTVDYGHGRDGATAKVEHISYGERITLRPDPVPPERSFEKEPLIPRDHYERDSFYERRADPYLQHREYSRDRERERDSYREKQPVEYERERYERDRHLREERLPPGSTSRSGMYRDRDGRDSRDREREGREIRENKDHYGRPGFERPHFERGPDRPPYEHSLPGYAGEKRVYPEERPPVPVPPVPHPPPPQPRVEKKPEMKNVDDILKPPGRESRPERIVIIMRGLPGSGKTHVAKLIRDKEVEFGGAPPRVLGLDDYFMTEVEKVEKDPDTGKRVKKKVLEYEYEPEMEDTYRSSMLKTFRKTLDDGFFPFIIIDAINDRVKYFDQFWSAAKTKGFEVYLAEITADNQTCAKRNIHGRKFKDIAKMADHWETAPRHMVRLDIRSLLQDAAIEEVEMEDFNPAEEEQKDDPKTDGAEEEESDLGYIPKSKWEMDTSEAKLDKLDGLRSSCKRKREWDPMAGMEDYLQLPDDYDTRMSEPGKKRVRWADLEEKKDAERKRAIGFVVGQTDWEKITDESGQLAQRALNRTKYF
uniref:YLP motif-containing protein 1 n=1 Tax=Erpetoichthys calabaricus TaxID=27687 RepID=A0A8C4XEA4_ERPCA